MIRRNVINTLRFFPNNSKFWVTSNFSFFLFLFQFNIFNLFKGIHLIFQVLLGCLFSLMRSVKIINCSWFIFTKSLIFQVISNFLKRTRRILLLNSENSISNSVTENSGSHWNLVAWKINGFWLHFTWISSQVTQDLFYFMARLDLRSKRSEDPRGVK